MTPSRADIQNEQLLLLEKLFVVESIKLHTPDGRGGWVVAPAADGHRMIEVDSPEIDNQRGWRVFHYNARSDDTHLLFDPGNDFISTLSYLYSILVVKQVQE